MLAAAWRRALGAAVPPEVATQPACMASPATLSELMRLRSRITEQEIVVYREPWGTLAFAAAAGLACLAIGGGFWWLMRDHAGGSIVFLACFCLAFVSVGLLVLFRLPRQVRQVRDADGAVELVANAGGLALTPVFGAETMQLAWSSIAEIVLAEKHRIVDSDGTAYLSRTVIVFLSDRAPRSKSWIDRVQSGIARSGDDRPYLTVSYPRGEARSIEASLRRIAPDTVPVRLQPTVVFDTKSSTDTWQDR